MSEILPYPTYLSSRIQRYLLRISEYSGRYIVFCPKEETLTATAFASVQSDSETAGAAIFIPTSKINAKDYKPNEHDPIIAHEATHLELWAEGWANIDGKSEPSPEIKEKVSTIYNWLTDPIINSRIENLGFSIKTNRILEVQDSIVALSQGLWTFDLLKNPARMFFLIRLYVSYSLEPHVPTKIKKDFQQAFKNTFPEIHRLAQEILTIIDTYGFDTPKKYKTSALLCMVKLGLNIETLGIYFKEPWRKFSLKERNDWAVANEIIPK